ncbi:MAG: response regulator [Chitinivibrionales bacterium]|nr:response regulator [Chitinivibrionales bacterium]MBD3396373.1 response regulator [Chitinivibrionales bacterium]
MTAPPKHDKRDLLPATVLVAEDDTGLNRLICKALARKGIRAEAAASGREALSRLCNNGFSLLLLDYMLPDMKGSAVVEDLRKHNGITPFVVMTGHGDQQVAVDMMKLGAREYLIKDTDFIDRLPSTVERVLIQIRTEQDLEQARADKTKLEAQLRQAQKMEAIGVLAGGVAHDFNNLLTAIHGYTSMALGDLDPQSKLYNQLEHVQRCAERASSLTRQLLLFSRGETASKSVVQLNDSITEMLKMLHRLIGEDVKIVTGLSPELRAISADPGNIEQIIMNLAVNARDAMAEGGTLTIGTRNVSMSEADCGGVPGAKPGEYVCLQISDTGTGMSRETRERIFEPFFTTKEAGKGTGLGLSVVYGIIRQHEGWVNVYSEAGTGTTFKIYLPAVEGAAEDDIADDASGLTELQGGGEGILVVEDDDDMREWCTIALGENGYEVFEATDAAAARQMFGEHPGSIALVVSDVIMPGKSGIRLAEELRAVRPDVKIVLSSGYTGERSGWEQVREQGYRFLQKPYTMIELLRTVRESL